jgi:hypothetical protein
MTGQLDPLTYANVESWVRRCYNDPSDNELIMESINEETGGFGVEAIRGRHVDNYHYDIQATYVNQGDTYDLTILLDHETGNFVLTSWGDWVESHEQQRQLF